MSCDIDVYTFHKLGLTILQRHKEKCDIADSELLKNIIEEFLNIDILSSEKHMQMVLNYFGIYFFQNAKNRYLKLLNDEKKEKRIFYIYLVIYAGSGRDVYGIYEKWSESDGIVFCKFYDSVCFAA